MCNSRGTRSNEPPFPYPHLLKPHGEKQRVKPHGEKRAQQGRTWCSCRLQQRGRRPLRRLHPAPRGLTQHASIHVPHGGASSSSLRRQPAMGGRNCCLGSSLRRRPPTGEHQHQAAEVDDGQIWPPPWRLGSGRGRARPPPRRHGTRRDPSSSTQRMLVVTTTDECEGDRNLLQRPTQ